jgi:hypothetical protein
VIDRRRVIKAGVVAMISAPILPILPISRAVAAAGMTSPKQLVIYDLQYDSSVAFASQAERLGATVRAIRSDMTRLWREELIPLWRSGNTVQMGMTGYDALFCVSMMARDWGVRPVYRMHHRAQADGTFVHEGIGPRTPPWLKELRSKDWARKNARILLHRLKQPFDAGNASECSREASLRAGVCKDSLVSWILAPIAPPTTTASHSSMVTS